MLKVLIIVIAAAAAGFVSVLVYRVSASDTMPSPARTEVASISAGSARATLPEVEFIVKQCEAVDDAPATSAAAPPVAVSAPVPAKPIMRADAAPPVAAKRPQAAAPPPAPPSAKPGEVVVIGPSILYIY